MTAVRPFAHLHCHTHYSLLDGVTRIPELVEQVKAAGMNSCAITDHGNLYGAIEFYNACRAGDVNPILGLEAYVAPGDRRLKTGASRMKEASFHLTLLAMNLQIEAVAENLNVPRAQFTGLIGPFGQNEIRQLARRTTGEADDSFVVFL